jgi:hypothetical protein
VALGRRCGHVRKHHSGGKAQVDLEVVNGMCRPMENGRWSWPWCSGGGGHNHNAQEATTAKVLQLSDGGVMLLLDFLALDDPVSGLGQRLRSRLLPPFLIKYFSMCLTEGQQNLKCPTHRQSIISGGLYQCHLH